MAEKTGTPRPVWLPSFSVGHVHDGASTVQKTMYRTFLRAIKATLPGGGKPYAVSARPRCHL
ncbi:hypothetical protein ABTY63_29850 [Streptomyces solisilvae]|uniref:hypothetical protein n=1 Tax=Streptomyces malaysiensis TaxID=92644 RepID=UPI00332F78CF